MNKKTLSLTGLIAVIVLCMFRYVFFGFYIEHMDNVQNSCVEHVGEAAFNVLADSLEYVSSKIELFELTDVDDNLENIPKREIVSQLSKFKNSFYYVSSVYLALENGQYFESTSQDADQLGTENQEWYLKTKRNLKTNFLTVTKKNKSTCGIISSPFYYKGKYEGVIAVEIDNALFKKIADFFGDDLDQLIISDEENNPLFLFDKNFKENDKYNKLTKTHYYMTHNQKEQSQFTVSTYTMRTGSKPLYIALTWFFSFVFVVTIGYTIWIKWKNNKDFTVGFFAFQIIAVMAVEITTCFIIYFIAYDQHVKHHENVMEQFEEQIDANSKYTAETIWLKVQEKKIFKENKLLEPESESIKNLVEILDNVSKKNSHIINFFFISKDGEYQNYPYNSSYGARDLNFQINRRLLNGSDRSTYVGTVDMEDWMLKEYVFKAKDDRNNYIGTFGVNLKFNLPDAEIAKYFGNNEIDNKVEYRDGIVSEISKDGEKTILNYFVNNIQHDLLNEQEYGIVSFKFFDKDYFAFVSTLKDDTKRLIPILLEDNNRLQILMAICLILSFVGMILSVFLAYKEKVDSITYENVEDNYEVELMNNEDHYYEMMKNDEEIKKGMKVMKIFGKKPSQEFGKKLDEYLKRKKDDDYLDF